MPWDRFYRQIVLHGMDPDADGDNWERFLADETRRAGGNPECEKHQMETYNHLYRSFPDKFAWDRTAQTYREWELRRERGQEQ